MTTYEIANIIITVSELYFISDGWIKFKSESYNLSNIFLKIEKTIPPEYTNIEFFKIFMVKGFLVRLNREDIAYVSENWMMAQIYPIQNKENFSLFLAQIFYTHAVQRHMIQIHSSLIEYKGRGLMFLGPSGIGKTTQAELWSKYRDALIINGDIVFVQETEECFLGWGTPWHGSSPYCENTSVPVHAMIVLKQAPENSIRELTGIEKVTTVSDSVFYPRWLENGMELCLETLDHLMSALPVYELSCRPDEDAVALTEKTVFGGC